ncbi:MAG: hypothetical protein LBI04_08550 [Treponema sp.]|jgi:hypothetical protein|nr:hypothetical protein [Treponema sp.]
MDELGIGGIPVEKPQAAVTFSPLGEPITPEEVAGRLSQNLYAQLADGSDDTVRGAIARAGIYIGTVLRRLKVPYNLDDKIVREVVLIHAIYELHIALGHEEAGKEYRIKARDIIRAAWGDFPEAESAPEKGAAAAVATPPKRKQPWR